MNSIEPVRFWSSTRSIVHSIVDRLESYRQSPSICDNRDRAQESESRVGTASASFGDRLESYRRSLSICDTGVSRNEAGRPRCQRTADRQVCPASFRGSHTATSIHRHAKRSRRNLGIFAAPTRTKVFTELQKHCLCHHGADAAEQMRTELTLGACASAGSGMAMTTVCRSKASVASYSMLT